MITDTQVLSYYYKNAQPLPGQTVRISSITAAEFLLVQSSDHNKANYYPILPSNFRHVARPAVQDIQLRVDFESRRHALRGKKRTDQLIVNLGPDIPPYVEFGSVALTKLINGKHEQLYISGITHLEKDTQKKLREKFRFLLDTNVECIAATATTAEIGVNLLGQFMDRYQMKQNVRNTVNDVLVLATAIEKMVPLLTEDKLLQRFAAEIIGASSRDLQGHLLLDFSVPEVKARRKPLESKGYINRGWQIMERRGR